MIGARNATRNTSIKTLAAGRDPVRAISQPVSGWLMTPPSPMFNSARPRIAGSRARRCVTTGMWTAHTAKPRPNMKKPAETATRAWTTRRALGESPLVSAIAPAPPESLSVRDDFRDGATSGLGDALR